MVVTGGFGFGGDADGGLGGGTDGRGEETDGTQTAKENQLSGQYIVVNITLGRETNETIDYAPVLELYHLIMSTLGAQRGQLERQREIP